MSPLFRQFPEMKTNIFFVISALPAQQDQYKNYFLANI